MIEVVVDGEQLHVLPVRVALREVRRRRTAITGPELDLGHQAAADALLAIRSKPPAFRSESRFNTWADKFVILEVSNKLNRNVIYKTLSTRGVRSAPFWSPTGICRTKRRRDHERVGQAGSVPHD